MAPRAGLQLSLLVFSGGLVLLAPLPPAAPRTAERHFRVEAGGFAYLPADLSVRPGDTVRIDLVSSDVVHGLWIDGYELEIIADPGQTSSLSFIADRAGTFRIRCSITCGSLHPFMVGRLIVGGDEGRFRAAALTVVAAIAGLAFAPKASTTLGRRVDLLRRPRLRRLLRDRGPQLALSGILLVGLVFLILTGLMGTPVGNRNLAIIGVWIVWWAGLLWFAVPVLGRSWCSVCPLPLPGEWLQRRRLTGPAEGVQPRSGRRWPNKLRGLWPAIGLFGLLAVFSVPILTRPALTGAVLAGLALIAIAVSLIFERRTFCRYLCPIGGFIGLYAQAAPLELRVKDPALCALCAAKPCYRGSGDGYGCPWLAFPAGLTKNTACGLCLECLRTCPSGNIALNLRPPAADLALPSRRLDEAVKTLVMLGAALAYTAVFFQGSGGLKAAANAPGTADWAVYALGLLGFLFLAVPGLFAVTVRAGQWISRSRAAFRPVFTASAAALVPLGLTMWIAFTLGFVPANAASVAPVLSDPMGWGWNLFGQASAAGRPIAGLWLEKVQILVLAGGAFWAARTARRIAAGLRVTPVPTAAFAVGATISMGWLLL